MKKQMLKRILSGILCVVMCFGSMMMLWGCGGDEQQGDNGGGNGTNKPDALVIMTEELDGLFNPFYSTTANDGNIVGMTQIGMLSTKINANNDVDVAFGDNEAVVVKDFMSKPEGDKTVYTFVLKNNIKFSDGKPLTMNDVLFNFYVYLDPVYTGSSTMYSTDIVGLQAYRTQTAGADDKVNDALAEDAAGMANIRLDELFNVYKPLSENPKASSDYAAMKNAILSYSLPNGYKEAVNADPSKVTNQDMLDDYDYILKLYKEELTLAYDSAPSNFADVEPYKSYKGLDFTDPIIAFMTLNGMVEIKYPQVAGKDDKSRIESHKLLYSPSVINSKKAAIDLVYNSDVESAFQYILYYSSAATTVKNEFTAAAMQIKLESNRRDDGSLAIPNISGIVSLGHTTNTKSVTVNGNTYTVAQQHNADGTVKNSGEYDVLQITINGVDPKAVWNFAIAIAPQHYYGEGYKVDIKNNNFGVAFGSFDFMKKTIQSKNSVPMGAGPYMATNKNNGDNPAGTDFYSNNVVYFKANPHFMMGKAKIEKLRYQVVSSANALSALESGSVHYATPQFTQNNIDKINALASKGVKKLSSDQLGYGYIGINAGKVQNIYLRKAIMSAMDISLALSYYSNGTAENIYWPLSTVSWAYPKDQNGNLDRDNGFSYPALKFNDESAKKAILQNMEYAGVSAGDKDLEIKFTIAGANMTEHPAYLVFQKAAKLLNECGWDIEVVPDVQALTKLSTGSLEVWAAAWGSTVDPDMYQVYHKNSTATSTLAWGYNVIVDNSNFPEENDIIDELSDYIDRAREIEDRAERTALYKEAMKCVLDLAIELPVYQRDVLYVYDSKVIDSSSLPSTINPYTSPLDRIWEVRFVG